MTFRYPPLSDFNSDTLRTLLQHGYGDTENAELSLRSIRHNRADKGKRWSDKFVREVDELRGRIADTQTFDAILVVRHQRRIYLY